MATDNHIRIPFSLQIDLNQGFTMQSINAAILAAYPKDPKLSVVSVNIPLLNLNCALTGIIDPITDIQNAVARLYNNLMQSVLKPIWDFLYKMFNALKKFGLGVLDLKIPVLDLNLTDIFSPDFYDKLKARLIEMYQNSIDTLKKLLSFLKIPYPFMEGFEAPEIEIDLIIKKVMNSLWSFLFNTIKKIIDLIKAGLRLFDLATPPYTLKFSLSWEKVVDEVLSFIIDFFAKFPTLEDVEKWIKELAQKIFNVKVPTCEQLVEAFKTFTIPVFGKPEILLPNPTVSMPCIDIQTLIADTLSWINNFVMNLLLKFVKLVQQVLGAFLKLFNITFSLPTINIPMVICAVENTD
jgi:hypothetical protein